MSKECKQWPFVICIAEKLNIRQYINLINLKRKIKSSNDRFLSKDKNAISLDFKHQV